MLTLLSQVAFPAIALFAGALGGYEFGLATDIFFSGAQAPRANLGLLYGVDLIGACLGALVASAFLVPLFGFLKAATFIAVVNLAPAVLAARVGSIKVEHHQV